MNDYTVLLDYANIHILILIYASADSSLEYLFSFSGIDNKYIKIQACIMRTVTSIMSTFICTTTISAFQDYKAIVSGDTTCLFQHINPST